MIIDNLRGFIEKVVVPDSRLSNIELFVTQYSVLPPSTESYELSWRLLVAHIRLSLL